ncbi:hypothetical protein, partial [Sphingomonas gei]|uniref:hypothetical protein n=1 Tax=Sphingomonas gei TaxID=1395960 RepID=UPI0019D08E11
RHIETPTKPQRHRYVIGRARTLELVQEPKPLLRKRQGQRPTTREFIYNEASLSSLSYAKLLYEAPQISILANIRRSGRGS